MYVRKKNKSSKYFGKILNSSFQSKVEMLFIQLNQKKVILKTEHWKNKTGHALERVRSSTQEGWGVTRGEEEMMWLYYNPKNETEKMQFFIHLNQNTKRI